MLLRLTSPVAQPQSAKHINMDAVFISFGRTCGSPSNLPLRQVSRVEPLVGNLDFFAFGLFSFLSSEPKPCEIIAAESGALRARRRHHPSFLFERHGSPGAMPAPEFIIVLSAASGFAYAVKAVVGLLLCYPI